MLSFVSTYRKTLLRLLRINRKLDVRPSTVNFPMIWIMSIFLFLFIFIFSGGEAENSKITGLFRKNNYEGHIFTSLFKLEEDQEISEKENLLNRDRGLKLQNFNVAVKSNQQDVLKTLETSKISQKTVKSGIPTSSRENILIRDKGLEFEKLNFGEKPERQEAAKKLEASKTLHKTLKTSEVKKIHAEPPKKRLYSDVVKSGIPIYSTTNRTEIKYKHATYHPILQASPTLPPSTKKFEILEKSKFHPYTISFFEDLKLFIRKNLRGLLLAKFDQGFLAELCADIIFDRQKFVDQILMSKKIAENSWVLKSEKKKINGDKLRFVVEFSEIEKNKKKREIEFEAKQGTAKQWIIYFAKYLKPIC
ncbi:unnamed protein product [Caenorhabditis angaria]|uniref:Uncharacterized protein n=1 Tax=Caenorhabditis angaria TaxID=860376 RepID=A0A9P1MX65_9PELO|nr:unnamed protein product [Caenorhabditis angaria]